MGYEEVTAATGDAVIRFSQIESMMSTLIALEYGRPEKFPEFIADVLADEGFSYGLRCNAIRKVLVRNGLSEKEASAAIQPLRDLGGTRNLIAHVGKVGFAGGRGGFLHPKRVGEEIDVQTLGKLYEQLVAQSETAFDMLKEWLDKVSPYLGEFRRLEAEVMAAHKKEPDSQ